MSKKNYKKKKILKPEEFVNLWKNLPEFLKQRRLKNAYSVIRPIIKKQLFLLNEYKESDNKKKSSGHLYFFNTVKNFYDNVKLAFLMGKRKSMKNFTLYPARMCMESLMRFMYFCKQDKQKRDEIAEKELFKIYARLYKREKSEGIIKQDYIKAYNEMVDMSGLNVPNIDDVNEDKEFNSFPNMYDLCHLSGRKDPKNDYFLYKCLCEDVHGKLIAIVIRSQSEKYQNFTRATILLLNFCNEMVILVDKTFLDSQQRKSVEPCIKKVNETIMGPASFLERIFFKKNNRKGR